MTKITECNECEHPFDLGYETDAWDEKQKKYVCILCRSDEDA